MEELYRGTRTKKTSTMRHLVSYQKHMRSSCQAMSYDNCATSEKRGAEESLRQRN
jgi:hypothetical protein